MGDSLIRHVDPWQDAAHGACYKGNLDVGRLPRLSTIAELNTPLQVSVSFHRGHEAEKHGAVEIELVAQGRLDMVCQRCLGALAVELALQVSVGVVSGEAAARLSKPLGDSIVSPPGERLDIASVVEDEVLLAMPFAPAHSPGTCAVQCVEQNEIRSPC